MNGTIVRNKRKTRIKKVVSKTTASIKRQERQIVSNLTRLTRQKVRRLAYKKSSPIASIMREQTKNLN